MDDGHFIRHCWHIIVDSCDLAGDDRQFVIEIRDFGSSIRELIKDCGHLARCVSDGQQFFDCVIDALTNRRQVQVDLMQQVSDGVLARFLPSKFGMFLTS
jgi:hypothetical protein